MARWVKTLSSGYLNLDVASSLVVYSVTGGYRVAVRSSIFTGEVPVAAPVYATQAEAQAALDEIADQLGVVDLD